MKVLNIFLFKEIRYYSLILENIKNIREFLKNTSHHTKEIF